jgi:predicted Na+-dependent transporter
MFSSWVIFTVVIIIAVALAAGMLLGGRKAETRTTTTLVCGMRFASLGLIIIGTQLGGDANYLGPALTFALLDLLLPLVLAVEVGRKGAAVSSPAAQANQ